MLKALGSKRGFEQRHQNGGKAGLLDKFAGSHGAASEFSTQGWWRQLLA